MTISMAKKGAMSIRLLLLWILCCISGAAQAGWEVQWIDRFDGNGIDLNNWTPQIQANYNNEIQCYTDDDSSPDRNYELSGGTLKIIARRQNINCPGLGGTPRTWTSGRINSKDKQEFLYGRIESRIRFHNLESGTWPAFWMLEGRIAEHPIKGDNDFVNWPNPGAGEIEVWEWFSNSPNSYITNFFNTSGCGGLAHYNYPGGGGDVLEWHDYAIEWEEDEIRFYVDDTLVTSYDVTNCAQYDEPMFVLLNLAIGGNLGGFVDPSLNLATMEVDYIAHCTTSESNNASRCNESTPAAPGVFAGDLVIFDEYERTDWPAWDCCGGTMPAVVLDEDESHAETMQFEINGDAVVGFTARAPDAVDGESVDATAVIDTATLAFDLKMTASPGVTDWKLKLESDNAATEVEVSLSTSVENHAAPVLNQWQHYSFPLADLAALGLDISAIDLVLIYPEWGTGNGAVYRIDNLEIRGNVSRFAPVVDSDPPLSVMQDNPYSYQFRASDADNNALSLSAPQLPGWLDFDSESGHLSGTPRPADVGMHDVTLSVSDGFDSTEQSFTIEVLGSDTPPYFTSKMKTFAKVGKKWRFKVEAADDDGDSLTLLMSSSPGWLKFDPQKGLLSGKPNKIYRGKNKVRIVLSDGKNTVEKTLVIKVKKKNFKCKGRCGN